VFKIFNKVNKNGIFLFPREIVAILAINVIKIINVTNLSFNKKKGD